MTNFDVLPLVLSANGEDPQLYIIPDDLVLRVPLKHHKSATIKKNCMVF